MNAKMKLKAIWTVTAALLLGAGTASAGDLTGKIKWEGEVPNPIPITFDPTCSKMHDSQEFVVLYKVNDGGLGDVFVTIKEGLPDKDYPVPEEPMELDQETCLYKPYVFAMRVGQKLIVKNSDQLLHNVNVTDLNFNQAQLPNGKPFEFVIKKEWRFLRFKCDVHPWMFAYLNSESHPFFAVSKPNGTFTIKNLPAGEYVVEAQHRKLGKQTQKVTVTDAGGSVDFLYSMKSNQ